MTERLNRRELLKRAAISGVAAGTALGVSTMAAAQEDRVPRKQLGTTGKDIPILVMGCSQSFDPAYDRVLHRAFADGIDYLDTAQAYANGLNHSQLKPFIEQVGRDKLWITSKVMLFGKNATPAAYEENLMKMLPDLGTDYLEMFFLHSVKHAWQLDPEFIKMADDLKKRGVIKHFGFSCHLGTVVELMNKAASIGAPAIDAIQFRYSFAEYGDLELNKAIDACKKAGIGLIAMKTQASVPEDQEEVKRFQSGDFTLPQAKLKAVWADERIDAAVSEMTNVQILRENVAAAKSTKQLAMSDFQRLNQFAARTAHHRCGGCSHICESRVEGDLKIADQLRFLMYDECYGKHSDAKRLYQALAPAEREFEGVDLSAAAAACPRRIDIAGRLALAKTRLA